MKKIRIVAVVLMLVVIPLAMMAQPKTLAELLGYPAHSKLLIIHGDDMGLSHSTNLAYMKAFPNGDITSGSVMVPCPWFAEISRQNGNTTNGTVFHRRTRFPACSTAME